MEEIGVGVEKRENKVYRHFLAHILARSMLERTASGRAPLFANFSSKSACQGLPPEGRGSVVGR